MTPQEKSVSNIKLKASVYDENGFEKRSIEFYAGNIISESELRELSPFKVYELLNREVGESFSNLNVPPGKDLDFMVVFYDLPPEARIEVKVSDWREGSR